MAGDSTQKGQAGGAAVGTAVGAYYGGAQGAAAGGQIGGSIGSMFGGHPLKAWKRGQHAAYQLALKYAPKQAFAAARQARKVSKAQAYGSLKGTVNAAKRKGLHPMAALGVASGGSTGPMLQIQGQPDTKPSTGIDMSALLQYFGMQHERAMQEKDLTNRLLIESLRAAATQPGSRTNREPVDAYQDPAPAKPHPSHSKPRSTVDEKGRLEKDSIPPGTPMDILEREFGDLAQLSPRNISRFITYMQNTNQLATMEDVRTIMDDIRAKGQRLNRRARAYLELQLEAEAARMKRNKSRESNARTKKWISEKPMKRGYIIRQ